MYHYTVYESCIQDKMCLHALPPLEAQPDTVGREGQLVQFYADLPRQEVKGFGGAFSQAAAMVFRQMSPENQTTLLDLIFGAEGLAYNCGRIPIGSCDFSSGNYAYTQNRQADLSDFSLEMDAELIFPFIKRAISYSGGLELLASPWSPPAFMKSNHEMCSGGKLREEFYGMYARYLVRYLQACSKHGVPIDMLTVQNEPHALQTWESCLYTAAEEARFIKENLWPALSQAGLGRVRIALWDHNKDGVFNRARKILNDKELAKVVSGIAFHWYSGDHFENLALCRAFFPGMELVFTEGCVELCTTGTAMAEKAATAGRSADATRFLWQYGEFYAHDIIGNLNAGMNRFVDWNLILDQRGGPNHVGNYCSAPIVCDTEEQTIHLQSSFYHISHFSRFISKNARILPVSRYTADIEVTAALLPSGERVVVLLNANETPCEVALSDVERDSLALLTLRPHSIVTCIAP